MKRNGDYFPCETYQLRQDFYSLVIGFASVDQKGFEQERSHDANK